MHTRIRFEVSPRVVPGLHLTCAYTELPSTIGDLKSLTVLQLQGNALKGEHLRSTRTTPNTCMRRAAFHNRQYCQAEAFDLLPGIFMCRCLKDAFH